ncbi:unnamed protein product [Medioppia subpectinata]|uniref:Uncharacterized protein n=1 Tax=Medioppia subpectinata TaxID=1979941 RepID=A0A7R9Q4F6_9ACAR|nr:unnamed protein product [Medioppia subpectinata]CAG2112586.1 unnamed protein product [Medioppia subpectinata]
MPDNETIDNNKRPKRRAAQRTYQSYENQTSVWSEDKDLKRALLASLQDVKKSSLKSNTGFEPNQKKQSITDKTNRSDSKLIAHNSSHSVICKEGNQSLVADNLLSLAAHRRARVSAQRKFAQSSGFGVNSPVSTPVKSGGFVASSNVVELFPNLKPNTEDFLTFLCLRRSSILPPNLDFTRVNSDRNGHDVKEESDSQISGDESEVNDKYTNCRIRSSDDRRGSASNLEPNLKQSQLKKISIKSNKSDNKSINSLKEKYKQQRIERKSSNPSKSVIKKIDSSKAFKENNSKEKLFGTERIQTRQQLRNHSYNQRIQKTEDTVKSKNANCDSSERVLRSHHSVVFNQCSPKLTKISNKAFVRKADTNKSLNSNSSQMGIKRMKRKARPMVPLIDYYFDSEFESDSEKKGIKNESKKLLNTNELKAKSLRHNMSDNKKMSKSIAKNARESRSPGRPKTVLRNGNKTKAIPTTQTRVLTRSSRPLSPPKDSKQLEREHLIKQQIIAIERKHKRLRRCPSNESLHSSSSSSSSSSSESLPNSDSSSSSINNTRLTRSLEHLKKIRDIAAKLKREQNKQNKSKANDKSDDSKSTDKNVKRFNSSKKEKKKRISPPEGLNEEFETIYHHNSDINGTEDSMASMDEDMERASIVLQDMAEDMNTLLVNGSENDLQYGSTEHIQGLMTCEFSGAFSDETVTAAINATYSLPTNGCQTEYSYVERDDTELRPKVDASTNTTEDDIMDSLSSDDTRTSDQFEYNYKTLSVGTQTNVNSSAQTDGPLE